MRNLKVQFLTVMFTMAFMTSIVAHGQAIYDSIPNPLPGNTVSQAFQAQQASEVGDRVQFSVGSGRNLVTVTQTMSSWGCESGNWYSNNCVTTPGSTFSHPITLNIYSVGAGNAVGTLIGTVTQTFNIPYRPSASAFCGDGRWSIGTDCFNGFATNITFNLGGLTVPDEVIYGIAFNTSNYGAVPVGPAACQATSAGCPYDSLNVALEGVTTVGVNPAPADAYFSTITAGWYCDGGTAGVGSFRLDAGCWTGYKPAVRFSVDTSGPTVTSLNATPSSGNSGDSITLTSSATDSSGLADIYYNLFTPAGSFVCNLGHVAIPGAPTSFSDPGTVIAMPFDFDTGVGGPCPSGGIADGSYVLTANWIDSLGNQVGSPNNQNLNNYPASAQFSPIIYDNTAPTVAAPGGITVYTGPAATSCTVMVSDATLGSATANDNLTGVTVVRTGVPAGNVFPLGNTVITYTATDGVGNTSSDTQTVTVVDNTAPSLTINGANPFLLPYGQTFVDPGSSATDNCGGTVTIVRTGGPVNSFAPVGTTFIFTYTATDSNSNTTVKIRTVKIVANPPANANACKNNGWMSLTRTNGTTFKNQGDCIQFVNTGK